jgi:hypothetical protein
MTAERNAASDRTAKKKITWVARYDGAIVDRRTTHVPYTHALIVQRDEEGERLEAYSNVLSKTERKYFEFENAIANSKVGDPFPNYPGQPPSRQMHFIRNPLRIEKWAKETVEGGIEGFLARTRQKRIEQFERSKRHGGFDIRVKDWLRQEEVAVAAKRSAVGYKLFVIVPVESEEAVSVKHLVAKLPKATLRDALADVCGKMIERKAWDDIASFLVGQLGPDGAATVLKLPRK